MIGSSVMQHAAAALESALIPSADVPRIGIRGKLHLQAKRASKSSSSMPKILQTDVSNPPVNEQSEVSTHTWQFEG